MYTVLTMLVFVSPVLIVTELSVVDMFIGKRSSDPASVFIGLLRVWKSEVERDLGNI